MLLRDGGERFCVLKSAAMSVMKNYSNVEGRLFCALAVVPFDVVRHLVMFM